MTKNNLKIVKSSKNQEIDSKSGLGLGTFIGKTLLERMKANVNFGKCPNNKGAMVTIHPSSRRPAKPFRQPCSYPL